MEAAEKIETESGYAALWVAKGIGPKMAAPNPANPPIHVASAQPVTLAQALEVLGIEMARDMPDEVRDDLADALAKLALRRGKPRDQQRVQELLTTPATTPRKQA